MSNTNQYITFLRGLRGDSFANVMLDALKQTASVSSRYKKRIYVDKNGLKDLPKCFRDLADKLKEPSVHLDGNFGKGQSIWRTTIKDSDEVIFDSALSLDRTRGAEPIIQSKTRAFKNGEKFASTDEFYNTNHSLEESTELLHSNVKKGSKVKMESSAEKFYHDKTEVDMDIAKQFTEDTGIVVQTEQNLSTQSLADRNTINQIMEYLKNEGKQVYSKLELYQRQITRMDLPKVEKEMTKFQDSTNKLEQQLMKLFQKTFNHKEAISSEERVKILDKMASSEFFKHIQGKIPDNQFKNLYETFENYYAYKKTLLKLNQRKSNLGAYGEKLEDSYVENIVKKLKIAPRKITNEKMIKELKSIMSLPKEEMIAKAKDIIAGSFGLPAKSIKIEKNAQKGGVVCSFDFRRYSLNYDEAFLKASPELMISLMYHELTHAVDFTKMAKSLGLESYKQIMCESQPELIQRFNETVYRKALKAVDINNFKHDKVLEGIMNYVALDNTSMYKSVKYYSNILERNAYKAECDIEYALNGKVINCESTYSMIVSKLATQIQAKLTKIKKLSDNNFNEEEYFKILEKRAISTLDNTFNQHSKFDRLERIIELLDNDLQKLKSAKKKS